MFSYGINIKTKIVKKIFIILLVYGCSIPFDITEINNIPKTKFDPVYVKYNYEIIDLRIDIIRQTETEHVNDSTTETVDVPYHKLGFDLGNCLFFDLNENLSLRIDKLLNFNSEGNFTLGRSYKKKRRKIFENNNDTFCIKYPPPSA